MWKKSSNDGGVVVYQERSRDFNVGDTVVFQGGAYTEAGRVTAVHPGIGMLDVEFPSGWERLPVEDVLRLDEAGKPMPPGTNSAPVSKTIKASISKESCGSDCGCGGNCTCGGNCGCGSKQQAPQKDPANEYQLSFMVNMTRMASGRSSSRKLFALKTILDSDLHPMAKKANYMKALSFWWKNDTDGFHEIFSPSHSHILRTASFHSAVDRLSEGKKPFIASKWKKKGSSTIARDFVLVRGTYRVAACIRKVRPGQYVWRIGNSKTARGGCGNLQDAMEYADDILSRWGFALR